VGIGCISKTPPFLRLLYLLEWLHCNLWKSVTKNIWIENKCVLFGRYIHNTFGNSESSQQLNPWRYGYPESFLPSLQEGKHSIFIISPNGTNQQDKFLNWIFNFVKMNYLVWAILTYLKYKKCKHHKFWQSLGLLNWSIKKL